ncbi:DUF2612 domain-containing protein [Sphingobium sp. WCS2017Hpa-17]|uniref:DUF2612 domain-containing protein n=1 Tax=Sphingobium sp. WCS2017Hpa-17 TaxID=3073638 RepID=UPI00288B1711|nr:DUF2612 domain-containing protein [Sphingobium sp. WCS2017Hpa-17]
MARFFDPAQTLLSQYANSPVLTDLIDRLSLAIDRQEDFDTFYDIVWNIDTAAGFGLDIWGRIVGVGRALYVPDEEYLGFSQAGDTYPFDEGIFYGGSSATPNYLLTDVAYRRVIMAKAALNITDGSILAINAILMALFPTSGNVYVRDNRDMTLTYVFGAPISRIEYAIVTQANVLPRPAGVRFTVVAPVASEATFDSTFITLDTTHHSWDEA